MSIGHLFLGIVLWLGFVLPIGIIYKLSNGINRTDDKPLIIFYTILIAVMFVILIFISHGLGCALSIEEFEPDHPCYNWIQPA